MCGIGRLDPRYGCLVAFFSLFLFLFFGTLVEGVTPTVDFVHFGADESFRGFYRLFDERLINGVVTVCFGPHIFSLFHGYTWFCNFFLDNKYKISLMFYLKL